MNKKNLVICLVLLAVPASFICFYATNLILSDVANMFYMTLTRDVISSLPIFLIAVDFVIAAMLILRCFLYPGDRNRLLRSNAVAVAGLSLIGLVSAVLTGTVIYGSFAALYPFRGAIVLTLLFHLTMLLLALLALRKCHRAKNSDTSVRPRFVRGVQWMLMAVFLYYAFDRLGAFLWMPVYVQIRTLGESFLFYLSLLLPACLLLHHLRYRLKLYRNQALAGILYPLIYLAADLLLCIAVVSNGIRDTQFVAAISPALGIERLLGMPVITIAHFSLLTLPILGSLAVSLYRHKRRRRNP